MRFFCVIKKFKIFIFLRHKNETRGSKLDQLKLSAAHYLFKTVNVSKYIKNLHIAKFSLLKFLSKHMLQYS